LEATTELFKLIKKKYKMITKFYKIKKNLKEVPEKTTTGSLRLYAVEKE
jgi:hypothetical protein